LTAAYAALDKAFRSYRKRIADDLGTETELDYYRGERNILVKNKETGKEVVVKERVGNTPGSPYAKVFDEYNKHWNRDPEYNQVFIRATQNWANDLLQARGYVFLSEVYKELGFEASEAGQVVGWLLGGDGDNYIDFGLYSADTQAKRDFINGYEKSVWLDFNVDGVIFDKIGRKF
jgi:hypothetical protein